jgi:hypothetical protein
MVLLGLIYEATVFGVNYNYIRNKAVKRNSNPHSHIFVINCLKDANLSCFEPLFVPETNP